MQKKGQLVEHEFKHGYNRGVLLDQVACPHRQRVDRQEKAKGRDAEQVEPAGFAQQIGR